MWKTLSPGEILFRLESHVFASEEYECKWRYKIPVNWSDTFLRIIQAIPGTLVGVFAKFVFSKASIHLIDKLL